MEISVASYDQTDLLEKVLALQHALVLSESSDERSEDTGFLISQMSLEELRSLLETDSDLVVATDDDGTLAAYLLISSGRSYLKRHPETRVEWGASDEYRSQYESGDFCYLEQLGVDHRYERHGLATRLVMYVTGLRNPGELLFAAILVKPVINRASHALFEKEGYTIVGELVTGELTGTSDMRSSLVARKNA